MNEHLVEAEYKLEFPFDGHETAEYKQGYVEYRLDSGNSGARDVGLGWRTWSMRVTGSRKSREATQSGCNRTSQLQTIEPKECPTKHAGRG